MYLIIISLVFLTITCIQVFNFEKNGLICKKTCFTLDRLTFIIIMLFLWVIIAFRHEDIGNDTSTYLSFFSSICNSVEISTRFEIGYVFLNKVISLFTDDPHIFLIILSSLTMFFTSLFIWKYSENKTLSAILFFFVYFTIYISALRWSIAITFLLYAYQSLKKDRKFTFLLYVLIATLFHTTSIYFLIIIVGKYIKFNKMYFSLVFLLTFLISVSGVLNYILQFFVGDYYINYLLGDRVQSGYLAVTLYLFRVLILYFIFIVLYKKSSNRSNFDLILICLALITMNFCFSLNILRRLSEILLVPSIIIFPNYLNSYVCKNRGVIQILLITSLLVFFLGTLLLKPEWFSIYNYKFFI